jgi:hypothetical protein
MNLRHAVAFALVGWYLMIAPAAERQPPLTRSLSNEDLIACTKRAFSHTDRPAKPGCPIRDSDAPFDRWSTVGSYERVPLLTADQTEVSAIWFEPLEALFKVLQKLQSLRQRYGGDQGRAA